MKWLSTIRNNVKLHEGSTKRGISAVITGGITLYLVFKGQPADSDAILQTVSGKVEFWIGIGLNVIGLLGIFIPDEPKTVRIELPALELQGRPTSAPTYPAPDFDSDRLHDHAVRSRFHAEPARPAVAVQSPESIRDQSPGWNG